MIAADVKQLYHALDNHGVAVRFHEVWDVGQAAFLIDSLKRDRSLNALSGDFSDDNSAPYQWPACIKFIVNKKFTCRTIRKLRVWLTSLIFQ